MHGQGERTDQGVRGIAAPKVGDFVLENDRTGLAVPFPATGRQQKHGPEASGDAGPWNVRIDKQPGDAAQTCLTTDFN